MPKKIHIDGAALSTENIDQIVRLGAPISLSRDAKLRVKKCEREFVEALDNGEISFEIPGAPAGGIGGKREGELSPRSIIASLSAGAGELEPVRSVRAAMLCKVNSLARGNTPIRLKTLETLIQLIDRGVTPCVHEYTSINNEGDSSALAEVAYTLMGNGEAIYRGELMPAALALKKASIKPVEIEPWEIKGLISGAFFSLGNIILNVGDAETAIKNELVAIAISLDTARYSLNPLLTMAGKRKNTTSKTIETITRIIGEKGTKQAIEKAGKAAKKDPSDLIHIVEVISSAIDAFTYARKMIAAEIDSAQSSPVFNSSQGTLSMGKSANWHSLEPAMSLLNHALCNIITVSSYNTESAVRTAIEGDRNGKISKENTLLLSSLQTLSQSISAECCSIVLPHNAIGCTKFSSEEMHSAPGLPATKVLQKTCDSLRVASSIEILVSSQIIDLHTGKAARGVKSLYRAVRNAVSPFSTIKPLHDDIDMLAELLREGYLLKKVERLAGPIAL